MLGPGVCRVFRRPLLPIVRTLEKFFPTLEHDIFRAKLEMDTKEYLNAAIINIAVAAVLFTGLFLSLSIRVQGKSLVESIPIALAAGVGSALLVGMILSRYPSIIAGKKGEEIDTYLVFALKELLLQVSSGVSLYHAIRNVSNQNYGAVSKEMKLVVKDVNAGISMKQALEHLALRTQSPFLDRTVWQLVNAIRSGASIQIVLRSIIDDATMDKKTRIRDFAGELNLWGLLYMTFAVAVPSIGLTMMIILSTFGGGGIGPPMFIAFVCVCFVLQIIIIGLVKSRRPVVSV